MISFTAIEGLLYVLAKLLVIDGFQDMQIATDVLQFPQGFLGLVLPHITRQFPHYRGLCHILLRQRGQNALDIGPFSDYPCCVDFMGRTNQFVAILAGSFEPHQRVHFLVQVAIPRTEPVTKDELDGVKTRFRAGLIKQFNDNTQMAGQLAEWEALTGNWKNLFLYLQKLEKVS